MASKGEVWVPPVTLDLETASAKAFEAVLIDFAAWSKEQPALKPLTLTTDWYDVTPEMACEFLRRNKSNRKVSLATVRKYATAMKIGDWRATGQGLIFSSDGVAQDLQHRCWASLLGNVSFRTLIVTGVEPIPDLFAYIDDSKVRSAGDALYTSGLDGLATHLSGAIKLSYRYDHGALGVIKDPSMGRDGLSTREILAYSREHPTLNVAAHEIAARFTKALTAINNKPVALFFGWKVIEQFGMDELQAFFLPLGSGANLDEKSPILGLRNRLYSMDGEKFSPSHRLALLIRAFAMFMEGKPVGKRGFGVQDNEPYPRFEDIEPLKDAAE